MKFTVGYQYFDDNRLVDTILKHKEHIDEVYFSFGDIPNGRSTENSHFLDPAVLRERTLSHIKELHKKGIKLNLLLNGNCYGKNALARAFFEKIGDTVQFLKDNAAVNGVTTTSPLIARFIKENFEDIFVKASVNMEIGNPQGMDYLSNNFDGFYLKREYNRDIKKITDARKWCDENGKKLFGLANSGCLNFCSAHTFHDNLVSHEDEIAKMDNAYVFEGQCWQYLGTKEKRNNFLRITNFIRPEDVAFYEGLFDNLKLATRINRNPVRVIEAYVKGNYSGNVPDILEPNHAGLFYPEIIENKNIRDDFLKTVLYCDKDCVNCNFCGEAQKKATILL